MLVYSESCGAKLGEFPVATGSGRVPPQSAVDSSGNLYIPVTNAGKVQRCTPTGTCEDLITGLTRPVSTALDSAGNLYVSSGTTSCSFISEGKLVKYKPDGLGGFTEVGAFASLTSNVSTVAVNKSTNEVFVGRGCNASFEIEKYSAGGAKLASFGSGFGAGGNAIYNQIAIDETSGKVYATDNGNFKTQVYTYTAPALTHLALTTSAAPGTVECEVVGEGGGFEPCTPGLDYETGTEITLKAIPGANSEFVKWSAATGSAETPCLNQTTTTCTLKLEAASSANAEFELSGFPLTIEPAGNGEGSVASTESGLGSEPIDCGSHCSELFNASEVVHLTATPEGGHSTFTGWSAIEGAAGTCTGTESPCEVTMSEAIKLQATFELEEFELTISENGPGSVSAECNSAPCPPLTEIPYGTQVKLTAEPNVGAETTALEGTGGSATGNCNLGTESCEFTLTENSSVNAEFALETFDLELNESGPGSLSAECEEGSGFEACTSPLSELDYGTEVKVTAIPDPNAETTEFKGTGSASGCEAEGSPCTFKIEEDSSVTAVFALEAVSLQVNITGEASEECEDATEGGGLGSCAATYPYGHTVKVVVSPEANWELTALSGEGSAAGNCTLGAGTCEFAIEAPSTVNATAEPEAGTAELKAFKGGNGKGTVTSTPAGINCGTSCTEDGEIFWSAKRSRSKRHPRNRALSSRAGAPTAPRSTPPNAK